LVETVPFFETIGGSGGIGAVPFFETVGGSGGIGAVPFFETIGGSGGIGAVPFFEIIGGSGGIGAVPFFENAGGSGGIGAVPFFENAGGSGGIGAVPLAINTEESPWVVTTVFRPIAPVKMSMARKIADEIRDIVPPGEWFPERTLSCTRAKSRVYCMELAHTSTVPHFDKLSPIPRGSHAQHFRG
jgi:hypothetical protein